jgi:nucleolar protein 12
VDEDLEDADIEELSEEEDDSDQEPELEKIMEASIQKPERKRKRKVEEEDLEGKYMQKLAREEEKEEEERQAERRLKRQRLVAEQYPDMSEEEEDLDEDVDEASNDEVESSEDEVSTNARSAPLDVPLHESLAPSKDETELEKASRTVFLANVSTQAISSKSAKKTLLAHMASFFSDIPASAEGKPAHKVESIRFRSTAYAGTSLPKKAAFAKKELMDATTKSTNAYVVYSNAFAAREAAKRLNGTMVLDRHLRVDGVAHPAKTDHRRCVFVGNLGFVDDESMLDQGGETERKRSKIPSDIEEGLWRQFGKAGTVESVRVVRDEKTRVGKGFAYVQFHVGTSFVHSHAYLLISSRTQTQWKQLFSSTRKSILQCFLVSSVSPARKPLRRQLLPRNLPVLTPRTLRTQANRRSTTQKLHPKFLPSMVALASF